MFHQNNTAGVILAHKKPLSIYGTITAIRRITLVMRRAGINPIIIVTGKHSLDVERSMADFGVVFVRGEEHQAESDADYAVLGLEMAARLYGSAIVTSTEHPLVAPDTVRQLLLHPDQTMVTLRGSVRTYPFKTGSLCIHQEIENLSKGLFEAMDSYTQNPVTDPGVLADKKDTLALAGIVAVHNRLLLQPYTTTCIETENFFFDKRTLLLLNLIEEFASVKKACGQMAMSYAKAWDSLNTLEEIVGYQVIARSHGGKRGGGTTLTEAGKRFIELYDAYNEAVKKHSKDTFFDMFPEFWASKDD